MIKLISRFAASPFSGYLFMALAAAGAGAGYWFWTELKEFGSLEVRAEQQERQIKSLENETLYYQARADQRNAIGTELAATVSSIESKYRNISINFAKELSNAPQSYIDCRSVVVPIGLRHPDTGSGIPND